jgi:hypothetical protein
MLLPVRTKRRGFRRAFFILKKFCNDKTSPPNHFPKITVLEKCEAAAM